MLSKLQEETELEYQKELKEAAELAAEEVVMDITAKTH
jgi:hypothetical protein